MGNFTFLTIWRMILDYTWYNKPQYRHELNSIKVATRKETYQTCNDFESRLIWSHFGMLNQCHPRWINQTLKLAAQEESVNGLTSTRSHSKVTNTNDLVRHWTFSFSAAKYCSIGPGIPIEACSITSTLFFPSKILNPVSVSEKLY